ncbi:anti-sigma factor antagonist [Nocardia sp. NEAU-G5]|uniref:Anti-sigma factor antagonist n=1 Tax=Nocardia albiluteola TaxID=2842303 RepID=A0ABS6B6S4_9NOCA|nr:anti-sigma factor antagonist [Nocardia albiluteola]MBU3066005.1 anti-sigma factor antagonist [Nocardia albiluteola]
MAEPEEDVGARLSAVIARRGSAVVFRPQGEADAYTLRIWQRLLRQACEATDAPGLLVVETTGLRFISCRAFTVLADEADRCRSRGIELRLAGNQPVVTRLIDVAGLGGQLPVYSCIATAVAAAPDLR